MSEKLLREEMYELVWTTPVKTLSTDLACRMWPYGSGVKRQIFRCPKPGTGRKCEPAKGIKPRLPARSPGKSEFVDFGTDYYSWRMPDSELLGPIPDPPQFDEPLELVRQRCRKMIGSARVAERREMSRFAFTIR